ncbi:AAA family ATPase [Phragmitibacter flavus]|uniref:AAA family ATPase n=1 Tax=Phragmitibacter flavus TaxID=2576071 RepID=A0A5R8KA08_9BACT|nr:RNA repair transcriptional activator RtcR [Phragmitibacter flavus]TLD69150.1 AAA family ATPase [Phragmitibacter flavus]
MSHSRKTVVFGVVGSVLDRHAGPERWSKWRPTVGLCQHEDLLVGRLELFCDGRSREVAEMVKADVEQVSPETEVRLIDMPFRDAWDFQEVYEKLFDWAKGYAFDVDHEDYLVHLTTGTHVTQICWFLLNEARFVPGRLLQTSPPPMKMGRGSSTAGRYEVIDLDLSRYERLATRFAREQEEAVDFLKSGIQTKNAGFNALMEQIERVGLRSSQPMLLTGPTGAGKSMLAGRIFELRKQRAGLVGRFVEVNCATLRGDQAMSALFGHRRGAFTGAQSDRAGLLKEADKGLLFLDEIGELGLDEQAMLLRALEDKTFLPLGSDRMVGSDFQFIAGTNKDLRAEVAGGRFREDLLARINVWTFALPGLAERREDIEGNVGFELERFARVERRQVRFNKEALEMFLRFAHGPQALWTSNFRDLNAAVMRMATLAPRGRITTDCVEAEMGRLREGWRRPGSEGSSFLVERALGSEGAEKVDEFDRVQLEHVLRVCGESVSLSVAGRKLFAVSRETKAKANDADRLKKYLARFGLDWGKVKSEWIEA